MAELKQTKKEKSGSKVITSDLKPEKSNKKEKKEMATEKKTEKKTKGKGLKSDVIADLKEVQLVVKEAVDGAADNVERVHQKLVSLPPKYLGKIEQFENVSKDIQDIQEKTLGHVYDLVKIINDKFSDITEDFLTKNEPKLEKKK